MNRPLAEIFDLVDLGRPPPRQLDDVAVPAREIRQHPAMRPPVDGAVRRVLEGLHAGDKVELQLLVEIVVVDGAVRLDAVETKRQRRGCERIDLEPQRNERDRRQVSPVGSMSTPIPALH